MSGSVTVSVRQGALRGQRSKTPSGQPFLSFQGIPYAQPPVGHRRFKPPVPLESWTGIRDATKPGNKSVQYDPASKKIVGDEDCLFLNVFTPRLPTGRKEEKAAGSTRLDSWGAFLLGSGDLYGPEPLMEHDVVLVTINYRLGPLGFLSLGTVDAPGNAGLKDQTMALRWVKHNIHVFGGDPDNVTIFGESAGGTSVHYQVLTPLSKGLFRRAIAQSGSACMAWALSRDPAGRAKRLALAAGCDWDTSESAAALLKWLRAAPPDALVAAVEAAKTSDERRRGVLATFVPCVEPAATSDPFLPDEPDALLANGAAQRVPIVFGLTSHEGIFLLPGSLFRVGMVAPPEGAAEAMARGDAAAAEAALEAAADAALAETAGDLQRLLPDKLVAGRPDPQRLKQTVQHVKDFYFNGRDLSKDTLEGFVHLNTDLSFALGSVRAAREHARLGAHVYMYEFAFRGALNFLGPRLRSPVAGVCHGDELGYQFAFPDQPDVEDGSPEALLRRRMGRLWTDFAKGGNPTPIQDEVITTTWLPYSASASNYLKISEDLEAHTGFLEERMQFWEDLLGN